MAARRRNVNRARASRLLMLEALEARYAPAGVLGASLYSLGGEVQVRVLSGVSDNANDLYLVSPGPQRFLASKTQTAPVVVGTFLAGTELVFGDDSVGYNGGFFQTGPG